MKVINKRLLENMLNNNDNDDNELCFHSLSCNPAITMDIIEKNPLFPWKWVDVSKNPNLTIEMILNNKDKHWEWDSISINPAITIDIIKQHLSLPWYWGIISEMKNITIDIVSKNLTLPWNVIALFQNPYILNEHIKANPAEATLDWKMLQYDPTITMDMVNNTPNKNDINWRLLSQNKFLS